MPFKQELILSCFRFRKDRFPIYLLNTSINGIPLIEVFMTELSIVFLISLLTLPSVETFFYPSEFSLIEIGKKRKVKGEQ